MNIVFLQLIEQSEIIFKFIRVGAKSAESEH